MSTIFFYQSLSPCFKFSLHPCTLFTQELTGQAVCKRVQQWPTWPRWLTVNDITKHEGCALVNEFSKQDIVFWQIKYLLRSSLMGDLSATIPAHIDTENNPKRKCESEIRLKVMNTSFPASCQVRLKKSSVHWQSKVSDSPPTREGFRNKSGIVGKIRSRLMSWLEGKVDILMLSVWWTLFVGTIYFLFPHSGACVVKNNIHQLQYSWWSVAGASPCPLKIGKTPMSQHLLLEKIKGVHLEHSRYRFTHWTVIDLMNEIKWTSLVAEVASLRFHGDIAVQPNNSPSCWHWNKRWVKEVKLDIFDSAILLQYSIFWTRNY